MRLELWKVNIWNTCSVPLSPITIYIHVTPQYSNVILHIIKRIYDDNNNNNCYQWIKSKCVRMVTFVCRRYHITCRFSATAPTTHTRQCYRLFEYAHSCPALSAAPTPSAPHTKYCTHSPTTTTTSFRTWLISMGFRFGMESRRRTVSCRTHGPK